MLLLAVCLLNRPPVGYATGQHHVPATYSGINVSFPSKTQTNHPSVCGVDIEKIYFVTDYHIVFSSFWIMLVGCGASFTFDPILSHCFGGWPYSLINIFSLVDVQIPITWRIWPIIVDTYVLCLSKNFHVSLCDLIFGKERDYKDILGKFARRSWEKVRTICGIIYIK